METLGITPDVAARMDAFRLRGNDEFKKGNWAAAVAVFTQGLACATSSESEGDHTEVRAVLLSNRSIAHARLKLWRASLDDAIASLALKRDAPKAWARAITAVTRLELREAAEDCIIPKAKEALSKEQMATLMSMVKGVLEETPNDVPEENIQGMFMSMLGAEGAPWLALFFSGLLLRQVIDCKRAGERLFALRNLRDQGAARLIITRLVEIESGEFVSGYFLTRAVAETLYDRMISLVKRMGEYTVEFFAVDQRFVKVLKLSFIRPVPNDLVGLRTRQLHFVKAVAGVWGLPRVRGLFKLTPRMVKEFVEAAERLPWQIRSGRTRSGWGMLAVEWLQTLLVSGEEVVKAGGVELVARLLAACAGPLAMNPSDPLLENAPAAIVGLAELIFRPPGSSLEKSFGKGAVAEAKLRWMAAGWSCHPHPSVREKGSNFMAKLFPALLKKQPSDEVLAIMKLRICNGLCDPQAQEKTPGEFVLFYSRPTRGAPRSYFCSSHCFQEHAGCMWSARERLRTSSTMWNTGLEAMQKCQMGDLQCRVRGFLGERDITSALSLCELGATMTDLRKSAGQFVTGGAVMLMVEERGPKSNSDLAYMRSNAGQAQDLQSLVSSGEGLLGLEWLSRGLQLLILQREVDKSVCRGERWHNLAANVQRGRELREAFGRMGSAANLDFLVPMQRPLSALKDLASSLCEVPESLASESTVPMRLLEFQALVVLNLMWHDPHLYGEVVNLLDQWKSMPMSWDLPHAWMLRGQIYSLLYLLAESHGCAECKAAGEAGWVASWKRCEQLSDSEELGISDVIRFLSRVTGNGRDTSALLAAADAAERCSAELWGEEVERQRLRISPDLRALWERFPPPIANPSPSSDPPNHKQCAACGKTRKRGTNGGERVKLKICASCQLVAYCSQECQKSDWKTHKPACRKKEATVVKDSGAMAAESATNSQRLPTKSYPHHHYILPDPISNLA